MHGIIHTELQRYVETKHGPDAWEAVLQEAGLNAKIYMAISTYPDKEILAIVTAASRLTHIPTEYILEDFGEFIVPSLMHMYQVRIDPAWKTMELLLHTEGTIHKTVRLKKPGAQPPRLKFEKTGPTTLRLLYTSSRKMSAVAKGIIRGVANYYGELVTIQEHKQADGCSEMNIMIWR
ncbi:MAG: heme NO-binding domain-containing protein [Anaerolineae bacterium]|nr:heme NO-binding domain-containing protein [Anaerolineae bacterium]